MNINGVTLSPLHRKRLREAMLAEKTWWQGNVDRANSPWNEKAYKDEVARCTELLAAIDKEPTECTRAD